MGVRLVCGGGKGKRAGGRYILSTGRGIVAVVVVVVSSGYDMFSRTI